MLTFRIFFISLVISAHDMTIRARVFLLFLSGVILGMDVEGFPAAMACKGAMEMTKEVGPLWREGDQKGKCDPCAGSPLEPLFCTE